MAAALLVLSILIQTIAAIAALRLAWASRRGAWLALSLAILLMGVRRSYSLYRAVAFGHSLDAGAESIALGISLLMAIGVLGLYLALRAAQRGASPDDAETPRPFPAAQYHVRLAILLGAIAVLGICVVGYFAHRQSSREILANHFSHNLQVANLMAGYVEASQPTSASADDLGSLKKFWQRSERQFPGSYLCMIEADGRLTMHTAVPTMVGSNVGDNSLHDEETHEGPETINELIDQQTDWTGWFTAQNGQRQIVSFAYLQSRNALLAVHLPEVDVAARMSATTVPWISGLAVIGVVFIPMSLGLLHWGYSSALAGRVQAEEALRQRETTLEALLGSSLDPMLTINAEGIVQMASDSVVTVFGWLPDEILGQNIKLLMPEPYHSEHDGYLEKYQRTGQTTILGATREVVALRKDGEEFPCEITVNRVDVPGEEAPMFMGFLRDISERVEAQAAREALIEELEDKNAELERFTYTVSHDLKSPLVTIKGFLGMLEQDLADSMTEQVAADIGTISNATDSMGRLLDELLQLSRIGRVVAPPVDIPLGELVDETLRLLSGRIAESKARIVVSDDLPVVRGDRNRLREVLQNLIDNALKFTDGKKTPHIEIGVRRDGRQAVYYVKDDGIGIQAKYRDRVFDLFEQLGTSVQGTGVEGTGVGLAIVKRIIAVHGGRIWVESNDTGQGTAFCFTLNETATRSGPISSAGA